MGRPGRRCADEERKLMDLLEKCYNHLNNNFSKFDLKTQNHIALTLLAKRVPSEINVESESTVTHKIAEQELDERKEQVASRSLN